MNLKYNDFDELRKLNEIELEDFLFSLTNNIGDLFEYNLKRAMEYNDSLCKPLGSLGKLEDIYSKINGIFYEMPRVLKKAVVVYSSDNGVCEEKVSSNPQDTTYKVCLNILNGGSGLCKIAKFYKVDVFLEDIGVIKEVKGHSKYKISFGTKNFINEPAMERRDALLGIFAGFYKVKELVTMGYNLLGFGEMGVGNTTTSSAIIAKILNKDAKCTTGFGSGLTSFGLDNKIRVINLGIKQNEPYIDTIDILRKLGGYDICAMVGSYLAASYYRIPFVLDGVISMAAYLIANKINNKIDNFVFTSHMSKEKGARVVEEYLTLSPPLNLDMRLGEGSGCPISMNLIELAIYSISNMATFNDVAVNKNDYVDIRKGV